MSIQPGGPSPPGGPPIVPQPPGAPETRPFQFPPAGPGGEVLVDEDGDEAIDDDGDVEIVGVNVTDCDCCNPGGPCDAPLKYTVISTLASPICKSFFGSSTRYSFASGLFASFVVNQTGACTWTSAPIGPVSVVKFGSSGCVGTVTDSYTTAIIFTVEKLGNTVKITYRETDGTVINTVTDNVPQCGVQFSVGVFALTPSGIGQPCDACCATGDCFPPCPLVPTYLRLTFSLNYVNQVGVCGTEMSLQSGTVNGVVIVDKVSNCLFKCTAHTIYVEKKTSWFPGCIFPSVDFLTSGSSASSVILTTVGIEVRLHKYEPLAGLSCPGSPGGGGFLFEGFKGSTLFNCGIPIVLNNLSPATVGWVGGSCLVEFGYD